MSIRHRTFEQQILGLWPRLPLPRSIAIVRARCRDAFGRVKQLAADCEANEIFVSPAFQEAGARQAK